MRSVQRVIGVVALLGLILWPSGAAAHPHDLSGTFTVQLLGPPAATSVGHNCLLNAPVQLSFSGSLTGNAVGTIEVLILAPCSEASVNPPGTFRDVFRVQTTFTGAILSNAGTAQLVYKGQTAPDGDVSGQMIVKGRTGALADTHGMFHVQATAGVGGTYNGKINGVP